MPGVFPSVIAHMVDLTGGVLHGTLLGGGLSCELARKRVTMFDSLTRLSTDELMCVYCRVASSTSSFLLMPQAALGFLDHWNV